MQFTCEHCGSRYVLNDELVPGRMYRTTCKGCGHVMVLKAGADGIATATSAPKPSAAAPSTPAATAAPPAMPVPTHLGEERARPAPARYRPPPQRWGGLLAIALVAAIAGAALVVAIVWRPWAQQPGPSAPARPAPPPPPVAAAPAPAAGPAAEPATPPAKDAGADATAAATPTPSPKTPPADEPAAAPAPVAEPPAAEKPARSAPEERTAAKQPRPAKVEKEKRTAKVEKPEPREKPAREKPAPAPEGLSPDAVQKVLSSGHKAFDVCLQDPSRGLDRPLEARQVRLRSEVERDGGVSAPSTDDAAVSAAPVGQCLKAAALALVFPPFRGEPIRVDTPIAIPAVRAAAAAPAPAAAPAAAVAPAAATVAPPPPKAEPVSSGGALVVHFASAKATRSGGEIGDMTYSEKSDDSAITDRQFADGVVTWIGQVGFGKGSRWAGIGLTVNILPGAKAIDGSRFKTVTFRLASSTTRSLRLRLVGADQSVTNAGCYPITLQRVSKDLKDYTMKLSEFDTEAFCGGRGRSVSKTLPELVGFEVADVNLQGKPTSFSIGSITLSP